MGPVSVNGERFSPSSLMAGVVLVGFGVWIIVGGVTFNALFPALLGSLGLILLTSGLARRR
jgi:hypothetical protein